jgi:hypothetical protein
MSANCRLHAYALAGIVTPVMPAMGRVVIDQSLDQIDAEYVLVKSQVEQRSPEARSAVMAPTPGGVTRTVIAGGTGTRLPTWKSMVL